MPVTPINKDMIPTRPRNMAIASNIFDDDDSKGVMPSDDPTVNSADRVSKRRLLQEVEVPETSVLLQIAEMRLSKESRRH